MSMEYCHECDNMIDLDFDDHWEHFKDKWKETEEEEKERFDRMDFVYKLGKVILKQMKGGKNEK